MLNFEDPYDNQYPRPDFQRVPLQFETRNGEWEFAFDDADTGLVNKWYNGPGYIPSTEQQKINVPFVYQTPASGINEQKAHQIVWYQTRLSPNPDLTISDEKGCRTILRFGAIDYEVTVWLAGEYLGTHRGGHVPFDFDITGKIDEREPTTLSIRVWDAATDLTQPRGKQYWAAKPEGIFYTPSTGIWQSVWLEYVPVVRICESSQGTILQSHDIESGNLEAEVAVLGRRKSETCFVMLTATLGDVQIARSEPVEVDKEKDVARTNLNVRLTPEPMEKLPKDFLSAHPREDGSCWRNNVALWSPEHPILYDITIMLTNADRKVLDEIKTSIGMRSLTWDNGDGTFRLNDRPYFQALVLDQGYWPETNMTPPGPDSCKQDIVLAKAMGFNGCRKHQKVEDPLFLYWADRLGFLVWGEMANGYEFSSQYVDRFDQEWKEAVRRDINHPCIVTWTPVNETWGYKNLANDVDQQNHIRGVYYMTKTIDSTRPINDNCGWEHVCTDLTTFHDYADGPQLHSTCLGLDEILKPKAEGRNMFVGGASHRPGVPVICTEFGGVNIALGEGQKGVDGEWGYTTASDPRDLLERVRKLMLGVVSGGHCCGFVYTQLTDIEQETNGLYTFDRKEKLPAKDVKEIIEEVKKVYFEKLKERGVEV